MVAVKIKRAHVRKMPAIEESLQRAVIVNQVITMKAAPQKLVSTPQDPRWLPFSAACLPLCEPQCLLFRGM